MRTRLLVLLMTVAIAAGCGASVEDPAAVPSTPTLTTPAATGSSAAPITPATPTAPEACGNVPVTTAMLADAQFAFIGTVIAADEEIHPWTTDPENPDRPALPTTTPWVTFTVDHWYLNDWGMTFAVWMPTITVATGDHVAVAGNAYFTAIGDFAGQSGEVELCSPVVRGATLEGWDEVLGTPFAPSVTAPTTTLVLPATKRFGEYTSVCDPTRLTNGDDDQTVLATGVACFLAEHDAGRPVIWDVLIPTDEGDPIVYRYDDNATTITITTDYSFDNYGSGGVIEQRCTDVAATNWLPAGVDCTSSAAEGFQEVGIR